jgi:hypothetical protein
MPSTVTIVLPTYGRPGTLACAVQSVLHQTLPNWRLLVIGDGCGEETAAALAPFLVDPRILYVNLPWRCGEQALPNSAGMACAGTDWIAFLNHDDLWLPTHLEAACRQLKHTGADFFLGRSAWIWEAPANADTPLAIETVSPLEQSFHQVFTTGFQGIEPVSAWVIARSLAHRVGPWRRAVDLFRTPIQDWVLRAYRAGARITPGVAVSCLKFENQWLAQASAQVYDTPAHPQEAALRKMQIPAELRALTQQLERLAEQPEAVGRHMPLQIPVLPDPQVQQLARQLLTANTADYFLKTGLDSYNWLCAEAGLARGWRWQWALQRRTGETRVTPPTASEVSEYVARAVAASACNGNA